MFPIVILKLEFVFLQGTEGNHSCIKLSYQSRRCVAGKEVSRKKK